MWYEKLIKGLSGHQVINDSKTPSGRVHVGSLRGVLVHDAIYRALQDRGVDVAYKFGIDDYDPLDGLPHDAEPALKAYMGYPLCSIPAPAGSNATDLADHYIADFLDIFAALGVGAKTYRMRDLYRSGQFNEAIDAILKESDVVREVYADVSNSIRPDHWHPFQVICESCGRIGATEVIAYDGKEVTYRCREDLVSWASGCGHQGKISPFDGNGKLPWKLEWVAKWRVFPVTIEGAGKDHYTKGGSREVAAHCLRKIFGGTPPLDAPYEFFLVSGAKMSSSKGMGALAREIADFLPPEILRFLMIKIPPKRTVNFSTDFEYIVKLFNEHDRLVESSLAGRASAAQQSLLRTIEVNPGSSAYHPVGFQHLTALLQLPHIDLESEIEKRTEGGLSQQDRENLDKRLASARYWLDNYASEEDRVELQETLPASAAALNDTQKVFLNLLARNFPSEKLAEDQYQRYIFDTARLTPIEQKSAFTAIYRVLLDKDRGPKGGALLSYLDKGFLVRRFAEVRYSRDGFWSESGISAEECKAWLARRQGRIVGITAEKVVNTLTPAGASPDYRKQMKARGAIEITAALGDGKTHMLRVLVVDFEGENVDAAAQTDRLNASATALLNEIAARHNIDIEQAAKPVLLTEGADKPLHRPPATTA